jgi:hypothetical protein
MAAPTDMNGLRAAWRALAGGHEGEGWKTISIATAAPCMLLAGRHLPGDEEALLVGFHNVTALPDSHLPQGHGFEVSKLTADPTGGKRFWVALARRLGGSPELFAMMADDLLRLIEERATKDEDSLLHRFLSRIRAWQDFMDRHREGVLSSEAELGLFGELVVIDRMIEAGMPERHVIDAWQGPLDGLQDFMQGSGGIEVKATLSAGGFPATISSLEQLDDSLRQPLFLAAVRLALDPSGMTLHAKAEATRERLGGNQTALDLFDIRLMQAGLLRTAAERYTRRFIHISTAVMQVRDGFPRLTRAHVHPAIRKARYEIDLDLAQTSDIGIGRALELLGAI